MGSIDITDATRINTNLPLTSPNRAGLGGPVFVRGGTFLLDNSFITSPSYSGNPQHNLVSHIDVQAHDVRIIDGARISASTAGSAAAGNVIVTADSLVIDGQGVVSTGIFALGQGENQIGNAGQVTVTADTVKLTDAGQIGAYSQGSGNGGTIDVTATDLLLIDGKDHIGPGVSAGFSADAKSGNGGDIAVTAGEVEIIKGGEISTGSFGERSGGNVTVIADSLLIDGTGSPEALILSNNNPISGNTRVFYGTGILSLSYGSGDGGNITLKAPMLSIVGGAQVAAAAFGTGDGGTVNLTAPDRLVIDGTGAAQKVLSFTTGIFANAQGNRSGKGGEIIVKGGDLKLIDGGQVAADTFGIGSGGDVTVAAESLLIDGGGLLDPIAGIFAVTRSGGIGGGVTVQSHDVTILDGARISAVTQGTAPAGNVTVVADSLLIDGKGVPSTGLFAVGSSSGNAGAIIVEADTVEMINAGQIGAYSQGSGNGGTINVIATDSLLIDGKDNIGPGLTAGIFADAATRKGGDITVTAGDARIVKGGEISSGTFGTGSGGIITVTATHSLVIDGTGSKEAVIRPSGTPNPISGNTSLFFGTGILAFGYGSGDGGNITLNAPTLSIVGGAQGAAASFGTGNGGSVELNAKNSLLIDGSGAVGNVLFGTGIFADAQGRNRDAGSGGTVSVHATDATITAGGQIAASTFGGGDGGTVAVTAKNALLIDGSHSGIFAVAGFVGLLQSGMGGDVIVSAGGLSLENRGAVSAASFTSGKAGSVRLSGIGTLSMDSGSSISSANSGSGNGGSVTIDATGGVALKEGSVISTASTSGDAGDITLNSGGDIKLKDHTTITGSAGGSGGNISITTPDLLYLLDSEISAVAGAGGGNFQIDSQTIVLNNSTIRTNAPPGQGGNQNLNSDFLFRSDSTIIATGTINITAPDLDLGAQLITLPSSILSAANQLQERCTALLRGDFSSFISIGRGGTEPAPEELQEEF
jgi:large exoprotein involved in heme utilization and adhesion